MEKTVSELEQPIVDLEVDQSAVDKNTTTKYGRGRVHVHARAQMPEKQLFSYAEYEAKAAEYTGSSEYSYWKSVWRSFLKKHAAVGMLIIFLLLFIFTFVAAAISKYDVYNLRIDNSLMFTSPNAEFWFGTDNMAATIGARYGTRHARPSFWR